MSIRQRVVSKAPKFNGQKSGLPIESFGIDSADKIENFYLMNGQLVKVNGQVQHSEILLDQPGGVLSLHNFKDSAIAQRGAKIAINPSVIYLTDYTDSGLTLTSTAKLTSASWRDRLVLTNAQDAFYLHYSDTSATFKWFGLDPPEGISPSLALFVADGAGNVNQNDLYYLLALYDSVTNVESPCMGALPTADGIYELSPNGFLGPTPSYSPNGAGSTQKMVYGGVGLKAQVDAANALSGGRATHFIIYRAGPKVGGLYTQFRRVPLKDGGTYDGNVLLPINALTGVNSTAPPPDSIASFVDNTAFADLASVSPPTNNSPPPTPLRLRSALLGYQSRESKITPEQWLISDYSGFRHVRFFRDQMFGIGAKSFGFTVDRDIAFGSDVTQKVTGKVTNFNNLLHGSEVYQPEYWPFRWEVGVGTGQDATALGVLGDVALLAFLEGSTYYLTGSSPDNYVVRIMDTQKGCCHQSTVQETPVGVITLDRSGFVLWNKIGQGQTISDDVHNVIESIEFAHCAQFYSCYDAALNIYRCSVVTTGAVTSNGLKVPNITFILDLTTMQWSFERGSEGLSRLQFSVNSQNITSRAIAAGDPAVAGVEIDIGKVYDLVGSATNGRLYDYSSPANVTNPGDAAIEGVWTSGTINFGDDQHMKRMKWIYLRAKSQTGWKVTIEVIPDYDESRKFVLPDWDVVSSQSLWYSSLAANDGSLIWDSGSGLDGGRWASEGLVRQVSKIPVDCIAYCFQIRVIHKETDATRHGFAIESISAEGVQLGR